MNLTNSQCMHTKVINAWRMHEGYCSLCVCVCDHSSSAVCATHWTYQPSLCWTLKVFNLQSYPSYSPFFRFCKAKLAICNSLKLRYVTSSSVYFYLRVLRVGTCKWSSSDLKWRSYMYIACMQGQFSTNRFALQCFHYILFFINAWGACARELLYLVCVSVCVCKCVVTLAPVYILCATNWTYHPGLRWTTKDFNWRVSRFALPIVHKSAICSFDDHYPWAVIRLMVVRRTKGSRI